MKGARSRTDQKLQIPVYVVAFADSGDEQHVADYLTNNSIIANSKTTCIMDPQMFSEEKWFALNGEPFHLIDYASLYRSGETIKLL